MQFRTAQTARFKRVEEPHQEGSQQKEQHPQQPRKSTLKSPTIKKNPPLSNPTPSPQPSPPKVSSQTSCNSMSKNQISKLFFVFTKTSVPVSLLIIIPKPLLPAATAAARPGRGASSSLRSSPLNRGKVRVLASLYNWRGGWGVGVSNLFIFQLHIL